jgi:predicted enzyme related to lactoylglutathione lyase
MQTKANLIIFSTPASNVSESRRFYETLLGVDLVRNLEDRESYHTPVSEDGIDLFVGPKRHPAEQPMATFAVDDLDSTLRDLQQVGGQVVWGPQVIAMDDQAEEIYARSYDTLNRSELRRGGPQASARMGRTAIVQDPDGRAIGVMELAEHLQEHFQDGRYRKPLRDKQVDERDMGKENARRFARASS